MKQLCQAGWAFWGLMAVSGAALADAAPEVKLVGVGYVCNADTARQVPLLVYRLKEITAHRDGKDVVFNAAVVVSTCEAKSDGTYDWKARDGRAPYTYNYPNPSGDGSWMQVTVFYDDAKGQYPAIGLTDREFRASDIQRLPAPDADLVHHLEFRLAAAQLASAEEPTVGHVELYWANRVATLQTSTGLTMDSPSVTVRGLWGVKFTIGEGISDISEPIYHF